MVVEAFRDSFSADANLYFSVQNGVVDCNKNIESFVILLSGHRKYSMRAFVHFTSKVCRVLKVTKIMVGTFL